jgi:predicted TIM-barrel fold metal-dependent hydrolase
MDLMMTVSRRKFITSSIAGLALVRLRPERIVTKGYYTKEDFSKVRKIDIHFHQNVTDNTFPELGKKLGFHLITVNVAATRTLEHQLEVAVEMKRRFPATMDFMGSFSVDDFGKPDFTEKTISCIKKNVAAGALGFKVWKNIGMVLKNDQGKYVMVDDPGLEPVFSYFEKHKIPVMGHLGEPRNCWLPLDEITLASDLRYYTRHPEYHMFKHPEGPSYESLIAATENLLKRHPKLRYVGTHLASLEWSVDEMAIRLDKYPNMMLDVAARMDHLQYQSVLNKHRVRDFLTKYQNRIMYGSDTTIDTDNVDDPRTQQILQKKWQNDWSYLATDELIFDKFKVGNVETAVTGLKLTADVIDKIFRKNAQRFFNL